MGQSADDTDITRMTPAMWAAYKCYSVDPLKMLATMGADLEKCDGTYGNTALHWAVVQSNHTAINTLIKLNVKLDVVNKVSERGNALRDFMDFYCNDLPNFLAHFLLAK